jgi:hypothetical protein
MMTGGSARKSLTQPRRVVLEAADDERDGWMRAQARRLARRRERVEDDL